MLLGLLTVNFTKVYPDLRQWMWTAPEQAALLLGWTGGGYYLLAALWAAVIFPLLLLLPSWAVWRAADLRVATLPAGTTSEGLPSQIPDPPAEAGFWQRIGHLALPLLPLLLTVHLVLAVVKINAKAGFLPYALRDPSGVKSYLAMNVMHTVAPPGTLIPLDLLKWLVLGLLIAGILFSAGSINRCLAALPGEASRRGYVAASLLSILLLAGIYGATVIRWLFVR